MRQIERLLRKATRQALRNEGHVPADTMMQLAAEGYMLSALEDDIATLAEEI